MLPIQTFDARAGGNVLYKALAHPLAAEGMGRLAGMLGAGPLAIYDPDGVTDALLALNPSLPRPAEIYVSDVDQLGQHPRRPAGPATYGPSAHGGARPAGRRLRCSACPRPHRATGARGIARPFA